MLVPMNAVMANADANERLAGPDAGLDLDGSLPSTAASALEMESSVVDTASPNSSALLANKS